MMQGKLIFSACITRIKSLRDIRGKHYKSRFAGELDAINDCVIYGISSDKPFLWGVSKPYYNGLRCNASAGRAC